MRLVAVAPNPSIDRYFVVDRLRPGVTNRPLSEGQVAGGKGLNAARAAVSLGAEVTALGLLAGRAGEWIADTLATEGVRVAPVWVVGETRTCTGIFDVSSGITTELNGLGPPIQGVDWASLVATLEAELATGDAGLVTVSGSLPPGAPEDSIKQLAVTAARTGVRIVIDGSGESLVRALDTRPWAIKLNVQEALDTIRVAGITAMSYATRHKGGASRLDDEDVTALAEALARRSEGTVIITRSTDGAVVARPGSKTLRVHLPDVRGNFPVGSGDAFLAGLCAATLAGDPLEEALRLAAGAAVAHALVLGPGRLDAAEAQRLSQLVTVS